MRDKKKNSYLKNKLDMLQEENISLKQENQMLNSQMEENKRAILFRMSILKEKENEIENMRVTYQNCISDLEKAKNNYDEATRILKNTEKNYEKQSKKLLKQLRKTTK